MGYFTNRLHNSPIHENAAICRDTYQEFANNAISEINFGNYNCVIKNDATFKIAFDNSKAYDVYLDSAKFQNAGAYNIYVIIIILSMIAQKLGDNSIACKGLYDINTHERILRMDVAANDTHISLLDMNAIKNVDILYNFIDTCVCANNIIFTSYGVFKEFINIIVKKASSKMEVSEQFAARTLWKFVEGTLTLTKVSKELDKFGILYNTSGENVNNLSETKIGFSTYN